MDNLKRKGEGAKDDTQKKRRGKPPTSITPVPIPASQTIARIGLQLFLTPDEQPCTPQHKDLLSSLDFFMLSLRPFYNFTPLDGEHHLQKISTTLSTLIPPFASFSKIAELLSLLKTENVGAQANCFVCVPSTTTKKQQRVVLVLEPPPPSNPSFSLPLFSAFVQNVMDRAAQFPEVDIAVKIDIGTNEGVDKEWQVWSTINEYCHFPLKLLIALEIKSVAFSYEALRNRWKGENVKMVMFSNSLLPQCTKYPKPLKDLLSHFAKVVKSFVIQGKLPDADDARGMNDFAKFHKYLAMRVVNRNKVYGLESHFLEPYLDKLQIPLQPLEEDLTPEVYNVFEKCPVKYRKYQDAIYLSLRAREVVAGQRVVVMVVGAGRGPLVLQTIVASQRARRPVKIYALDKNPHAIKALQELQRKKQWESDEVVIVDADMRFWEPPEKADILVSELLGSFGDNELSPECLDAAQRFLNTDGISIPFRSNSFLAPISSTILYNQVLNLVHHALDQKSSTTTTNGTNGKHLENGQPTTDQSSENCNSTPDNNEFSNIDITNIHFTKNGIPVDNSTSISMPNSNDLQKPTTKSNAKHENGVSENDNNPTTQNNTSDTSINNNNSKEAPQVRQITGLPPEYYFEVGYVVKLHNVLYLDDSRQCFSFSHPNLDGTDNNRHTQIWFQPKMDGLLHGFAGFFEALLHEKIAFSTNPPNNDHNLVAWFPMYFPLKDPIMVRKETQVEVNFWRKCSKEKVWYEWCVGSPSDPTVFIHNANGRAYSMKL